MQVPCCPECGHAVQEDDDGMWNCTECEWVGDDPDHKDPEIDDDEDE